MQATDDTTSSERPSSFVDHRVAPYLVLAAWLVVLVAAFGIGLEYVGAIESDPDCSWDSCIQPFVGPLFWLLIGGFITGLGLLATAAIVGLLEFSGPASQRARFWIAIAGPGMSVLGYVVLTVLVLLA